MKPANAVVEIAPSPVAEAAVSPVERGSRAATALRWTSRALVATTWVSAGIFGAYILAHYGGAIVAGKLPEWNKKLPGLYDAATPLATIGIALHFAAGGILLLLGPLQFFSRIRARMLSLHRTIGWLYTVAAMTAGVGGLGYILSRGTIGGAPMSIGFGLYGALITIAGAQTLRYGRTLRREAHRAWAIRLFALTIASWLYRMDYGFWVLFTNGIGHTPSFNGGFDVFMDFFFYVPNIVVAELFVRAGNRHASDGMRLTASAVLGVATAFLVLATYFFTRYEWAPAIINRIY